MDIILQNGQVLPFDDTEKRVIYFGANGVGKTQSSNALYKEFSKTGDCLMMDKDFLSDIFTKPTLEIKPFGLSQYQNQKALEESNKAIGVDETLKKTFGSYAKTKIAQFPLLIKIKDNDIPIEKQAGKMFAADLVQKTLFPDKDIGESLFEGLANVVKSGKAPSLSPSSINSASDPNVLAVQQTITSQKLQNCPVCNTPIDKDQKAYIEACLRAANIDDKDRSVIKKAYSDSVTKPLIDQLLSNKDNSELWLESLRSDLEGNVINQIIASAQTHQIEEYNGFIGNKQNLNQKVAQFSLSADPQITRQTQTFLDKLLWENKIPFSAKIIHGAIVIKAESGRNTNEYSTSELHELTLFYFECLFFERSLQGQVSLILDDPFDSYDDANIRESIQILSEAILEAGAPLDHVAIFSHRSDIFNLYCQLKKNAHFALRFLDKDNTTQKLLSYEASGLVMASNGGISDFGLGRYLFEKYDDDYSFVVACMIYRNSSEELSDLLNSSFQKRFKKNYEYLSEAIDHCRKNPLVKKAAKKLTDIYNLDPNRTRSSRTTRIKTVFKKFDSENLPAFYLLTKDGTRENATAISLLVFKFLTALRIRQRFEKVLVDLIKTKYHGTAKSTLSKDIAYLRKQGYDTKPYQDYLQRYGILFDSFCHSSSAKLSPSFVYSLSLIQDAEKKESDFES